MKQQHTAKQIIEWSVLVLLLVAVGLGLLTNAFAYEYYYYKCQGKPTEIFGQYYRIPGDDGYGIHPGSDYSHCSYLAPRGKVRDPATRVGAAAQATKNDVPKRTYNLYLPDSYTITTPVTTGINGGETDFMVTTKLHYKFQVKELSKNSAFSYTNLCAKPIDANWNGTIIGKDSAGRDICKVNHSKYITQYIVGINIGQTAIMLEAPGGSDAVLNKEATAIFNAMKLHQTNPISILLNFLSKFSS